MAEEQQGWDDDPNANPFGDVEPLADVWRDLQLVAIQIRHHANITTNERARELLDRWATKLSG